MQRRTFIQTGIYAAASVLDIIPMSDLSFPLEAGIQHKHWASAKFGRMEVALYAGCPSARA
jgi:hypothetical protein